MPLTVNVGLSRKASENYQSKGLSINITGELDQSLLADPPRLQDEIDRIYAHAEDALERQSASGQQRLPGSQPGRPATESQMRALRSLAKRLDCELGKSSPICAPSSSQSGGTSNHPGLPVMTPRWGAGRAFDPRRLAPPCPRILRQQPQNPQGPSKMELAGSTN